VDRRPQRRFPYTKARKDWSLYWRDRHLKFHEYDLVEPTPHIDELIEEVKRDRPFRRDAVRLLGVDPLWSDPRLALTARRPARGYWDRRGTRRIGGLVRVLPLGLASARSRPVNRSSTSVASKTR
jgi:hypothetical protein